MNEKGSVFCFEQLVHTKALSLDRKKVKVILSWAAYEPLGWEQSVKAETECRHSRAVRSGSHNQIDKQRRGSNNNDRGKSCMERKRKIGRGKALLSGQSFRKPWGGRWDSYRKCSAPRIRRVPLVRFPRFSLRLTAKAETGPQWLEQSWRVGGHKHGCLCGERNSCSVR